MRENINAELYECLEEAVKELCHVLPEGGWDGPCPNYGDGPKCGGKRGECFVQRWIDALRKARSANDEERMKWE